MADEIEAYDAGTASIRRRVRLIVLLKAAEQAGLSPIPVMRLHTMAYLANVLAPVWDMPSLEGKILKRQGGPFYPALQADLDRLVGLGVAKVEGLRHIQDLNGSWRLEGSFSLNHNLADPIFSYLDSFPEERAASAFINELALALSTMSDADMDQAMQEDATYSDPLVGDGNVIDFNEWTKGRNFSANAANHFAEILPSGGTTTPGEKIHLYMRHLQRRIHGGL